MVYKIQESEAIAQQTSAVVSVRMLWTALNALTEPGVLLELFLTIFKFLFFLLLLRASLGKNFGITISRDEHVSIQNIILTNNTLQPISMAFSRFKRTEHKKMHFGLAGYLVKLCIDNEFHYIK